MKKTQIPIFKSNNTMLNHAFRIAYTDLISNIFLYKDGILEKEEMCILAGEGYDTPWTRDAAINTWNCGGLLDSDAAKNTLLSVLKNEDGKLLIGGEYWDAIIWATGAWWQYIYTGDKEFLKTAYEAVKNSLAFFEETEFDEKLNLFRGGACYGDGVSSYPDAYAGGGSGIVDFPRFFPEKTLNIGVGIPIHTLSTNCLYYNAYKIADLMAQTLDINESYTEKAEKMKASINSHFWNEEKGTYRYIIDSFGNCDSQEGMGISFAILFDVADEDKKQKILNNVILAPQGISCVWPSFSRYDLPDDTGFGRHSGTIWPHIEAFFADSACKSGRIDLFENELRLMSARAVRDGHFAEIYHPFGGYIYGGRQERYDAAIVEWKSEIKQTWSATGYLRLIIMDLMGISFTVNGLYFNPATVLGITEMSLNNLPYRGATLNISVKSADTSYTKVNDKIIDGPFLPDTEGEYYIEIFISNK